MYCGRIEARVLWEEGRIEIASVDLKPTRGWHGEALIDDNGFYSDGFFADMLKGRTNGVYDITGRYFEHYSQDYWGEWDGDYWLEGEKARFVANRMMEWEEI